MAGQSGEHVMLERFEYAMLIDPEVKGVDSYDPIVIPAHLRAEDYDKQLVAGAAELPGETPYDPDENPADYAVRSQMFDAVRQRIENRSLEMRSLVGEAALRQVLGSSRQLPFEELVERQAAAVDSIANDVDNGYDVGIVPFTADTRAASGRFLVVRGGEDMMVGSMRRGNFIEIRGSQDNDRRIERARKAFENLRRQSIVEPAAVMSYLGHIAADLRNLAE